MSSCFLFELKDEVLPSSFENIIIAKKCNKTEFYIRSNIRNMAEIQSWIMEFSSNTHTQWNARHSNPHGKQMVCLKHFVCHHSAFNKVDRIANTHGAAVSKNASCTAKVIIKIKLTTPSTVKSDPFIRENYPAIIRISKQHTHALDSTQTFRFLQDREQIQRNKFIGYFNDGMNAAGAKIHHDRILQEMNSTEADFATGSINPSINTISYWYRLWREEKLGPRAGPDIIKVCSICNTSFSNIYNLDRHIQSIHKNKTFKCAMCRSKFNRNDNLKAHCAVYHKHDTKHQSNQGLKLIHTLQEKFECAVCGYKFKHKYNLRRHIFTTHYSKDRYPELQYSYFECELCGWKFQRKCSLQKHIQEDHLKMKPTNSKITNNQGCTLCNLKFKLRSHVMHHYQKVHKETLVTKEVHFNCIQEFHNWKKSVEKSSNSKYTAGIKYELKTLPSSIFTFYCHRSGIYRSKVDNKNYTKMRGTKKLNGVCPAQMKLFQNKITGTCRLEYIETHIGHSLSDDDDERHLYLNLTKAERTNTAAKIIQGVPLDRIHNDCLLNPEREVDVPTRQLKLVSIHNLHNIEKEFNIKTGDIGIRPFTDDVSNVDAFITVTPIGDIPPIPTTRSDSIVNSCLEPLQNNVDLDPLCDNLQNNIDPDPSCDNFEMQKNKMLNMVSETFKLVTTSNQLNAIEKLLKNLRSVVLATVKNESI